MLTSTYALISLSSEQKRVHDLLVMVQRLLQDSSTERPRSDQVILDSIGRQLTRLDASCHRRKMEIFVIPAIMSATKEADFLLAELETLSATCLQVLESVGHWVQQAVDDGTREVTELYSLVALYCNSMLLRLAKEEDALLPLAQRVISSDDWFAIGVQFLSHDAEANARHQCMCAERELAPGAASIYPFNVPPGQHENSSSALRNDLSAWH